MKHSFLIILLILFQCRGHNNPQRPSHKPVAQSEINNPVRPSPSIPPQDSPRINPDECLLQATVIERDSLEEGYSYLLEVQDIFKKGFGFHENLSSGNKILARSNQKLNLDAAVIIAIEYVFSLKQGHYQINNILEK